MVDRASQPFALDVQREQIQGLNLGAGRYEAAQTNTSSTEQALAGLLNLGNQLAGRAIDQSTQEAYLEGQRARMAGQSAASVEADVFSRPFVNGGYNTEDYRIAQANMARDVQTFIQAQGRSMTPEDFAKVVQEHATKITPGFDALPVQGKLQALTAQQKLEESLFAAQAGAYQKFSIEQGAKRFMAQGNQITTDLVKGGPAYQSNMERAALFYTDLLTTDKLPQATRTTMAKEYLLSLANADQRGVIESLRDGGMLDSLSFKERLELDSALRSSATRTEAKDSLGVVMDNAAIEGKVAAGTISYEDLKQHITTETQAGRMSYDQGKTLAMQYTKGLANKDDLLTIVRAVGNGDLSALAAVGENAETALTKIDQQHALAGRTVSERMVYGIQQGTKLGTIPKVYGETIGQAVRNVQLAVGNDPLNAQLVETLNGSISALTVAEQSNPGARGVLLQAMPDDTRLAMSYAMQQQEFGVSPVDALKEYAANREAFEGLNDMQKALKGKEMRGLIDSAVNSASSSGFWGRIGNFVSGNSNLDTNSGIKQQWSAAIQEEANYLANNKDMFGMTPESYMEAAATNVKNRTIEVGERGFVGTGVKRRPLILPRGVNPQDVFAGVTDKQALGRKLSELAPPPADGTFGSDFTTGYSFNSTMGRLERVTFDERGARVNVEQVDAGAVGRAVRAEQEAIVEGARAAYFGAPTEVDGIPFQLDGANTQGLPNRGVYRLRKELAGMEGLKLTVYKDRNGLAAGMGHNVTGTGLKEGDDISLVQAEQWFREDTDNALASATRFAKSAGVSNSRSVAGLAGAAFQLGEAGLREHTRTMDAIRNRDFETFKKEVRSSAWAGQTPKRTEWFIEQMAPHFQELM